MSTANIKDAHISITEQNKNLLKTAVEEIWNKGDFNKLKEMVSEDFVIHFPGAAEDILGLENVKQFFTELRNAFPDLHFTIMDLIGEEDKVVTHWSATGTHKGRFKGIPPTGKKVTFTAMDIDKISEGKFVECWTNVDELGLMQQLGVFPPQG